MPCAGIIAELVRVNLLAKVHEGVKKLDMVVEVVNYDTCTPSPMEDFLAPSITLIDPDFVMMRCVRIFHLSVVVAIVPLPMQVGSEAHHLSNLSIEFYAIFEVYDVGAELISNRRWDVRKEHKHNRNRK